MGQEYEVFKKKKKVACNSNCQRATVWQKKISKVNDEMQKA